MIERDEIESLKCELNHITEMYNCELEKRKHKRDKILNVLSFMLLSFLFTTTILFAIVTIWGYSLSRYYEATSDLAVTFVWLLLSVYTIYKLIDKT